MGKFQVGDRVSFGEFRSGTVCALAGQEIPWDVEPTDNPGAVPFGEVAVYFDDYLEYPDRRKAHVWRVPENELELERISPFFSIEELFG